MKSPPPTSQRSAQPTAKPTAVDKNFADASSGFKPGSGSENSDGNGDKRLSRLYAALNKSLADVMSDERRAELINYIQVNKNTSDKDIIIIHLHFADLYILSGSA